MRILLDAPPLEGPARSHDAPEAHDDAASFARRLEARAERSPAPARVAPADARPAAVPGPSERSSRSAENTPAAERTGRPESPTTALLAAGSRQAARASDRGREHERKHSETQGPWRHPQGHPPSDVSGAPTGRAHAAGAETGKDVPAGVEVRVRAPAGERRAVQAVRASERSRTGVRDAGGPTRRNRGAPGRLADRGSTHPRAGRREAATGNTGHERALDSADRERARPRTSGATPDRSTAKAPSATHGDPALPVATGAPLGASSPGSLGPPDPGVTLHAAQRVLLAHLQRLLPEGLVPGQPTRVSLAIAGRSTRIELASPGGERLVLDLSVRDRQVRIEVRGTGAETLLHHRDEIQAALAARGIELATLEHRRTGSPVPGQAPHDTSLGTSAGSGSGTGDGGRHPEPSPTPAAAPGEHARRGSSRSSPGEVSREAHATESDDATVHVTA